MKTNLVLFFLSFLFISETSRLYALPVAGVEEISTNGLSRGATDSVADLQVFYYNSPGKVEQLIGILGKICDLSSVTHTTTDNYNKGTVMLSRSSSAISIGDKLIVKSVIDQYEKKAVGDTMSRFSMGNRINFRSDTTNFQFDYNVKDLFSNKEEQLSQTITILRSNREIFRESLHDQIRTISGEKGSSVDSVLNSLIEYMVKSGFRIGSRQDRNISKNAQDVKHYFPVLTLEISENNLKTVVKKWEGQPALIMDFEKFKRLFDEEMNKIDDGTPDKK